MGARGWALPGAGRSRGSVPRDGTVPFLILEMAIPGCPIQQAHWQQRALNSRENHVETGGPSAVCWGMRAGLATARQQGLVSKASKWQKGREG